MLAIEPDFCPDDASLPCLEPLRWDSLKIEFLRLDDLGFPTLNLLTAAAVSSLKKLRSLMLPKAGVSAFAFFPPLVSGGSYFSYFMLSVYLISIRFFFLAAGLSGM